MHTVKRPQIHKTVLKWEVFVVHNYWLSCYPQGTAGFFPEGGASLFLSHYCFGLPAAHSENQVPQGPSFPLLQPLITPLFFQIQLSATVLKPSHENILLQSVASSVVCMINSTAVNTGKPAVTRETHCLYIEKPQSLWVVSWFDRSGCTL